MYNFKVLATENKAANMRWVVEGPYTSFKPECQLCLISILHHRQFRSSLQSPTHSHAQTARSPFNMTSYLDSFTSSVGPTDNENVCPICHEEVSGDIPTLTHKACGRWFKEKCMMDWIDTQVNSRERPTCPNCCLLLHDADALIDSGGDQDSDWVQDLVDALQDFPEARVHHVRTTIAQVVDIMHAAAPHNTRHDLESLVTNAAHQAAEAIEFEADLDDNRDFQLYPTRTARSMVQSDTLNFDAVSHRHLWAAHRVLDCNCWFVVRLTVVPGVGVWLPWYPEVRIDDRVWPLSAVELPRRLATRLTTRIQPGEREVLSIPLATGFLCDRFKDLDDQRGIPGFVGQLEGDFSATHWCLVNTHDALRRKTDVVPWPEGEVEQGFWTLDYYGRTTTVAMSGSRIWDPEIEKPIRDRFIAQHALMPTHSRYLLSGRDGVGSKELAEECDHILRETYNIVLDGDIRMEEDEKWPMDTVESEEMMTEVDPMEVV